MLSTPPAFVLSQDQTLQENSSALLERGVPFERGITTSGIIKIAGLNSPRRPCEHRISESASHILTISTRLSISSFELSAPRQRQPLIVLSLACFVKGFFPSPSRGDFRTLLKRDLLNSVRSASCNALPHRMFLS